MLAQKPLADDLAAARAVVEEAERAGVKLAVNQNGRWAPPWRIATLLVEQGAIGEVHSVTHLLDRDFAFVLQFPRFDAIEHLIVYDHCVHWVDISRCWLDGKAPESVRALGYRSPVSRPSPTTALGCIGSTSTTPTARARPCAASAALEPRAPDARSGSTEPGDDPGQPSARLGLRRAGTARRATERFDLCGAWYVDGFAGAMASSCAPSPRAASRTTPDGTTSSRSS